MPTEGHGRVAAPPPRPAGFRPVRKRLSSTQRRAAILAVAKRLFADKGFHGVSVHEIVAELGVSPAVLYQHFPSKEALYEAVLGAIACTREDYIEVALEGPTDFAAVLERITRIYATSVARDPDYLRMEMHSVLEGNAATQQFFENRWKTFTDYIEYGLQELAREGRIDPVDGKAASLMFQGMIREALYAKCIYQSAHYRDVELEALIQPLIGLFLRAVGYRGGATAE